jgi:Cof subfamily protein (haloacid dehalogenase superfamily)
MKKLLVTDLDGTLVRLNYMPYDNYLNIKRFQAQEYYLAVATGRSFNQVGFLKKLYRIKADYYILLNGALIIDKFNNVIKHEYIPTEAVEDILSIIDKANWRITLQTGFKTYSLSKGIQRFVLGAKFIKTMSQIEKFKISALSLGFMGTDRSYISEVCSLINEKLGDKVAAYRNVNYIDIVPANCSKGSGIEYIKNKESIAKENIFAIGDSWNDISMFEKTDNSFTLRTAEELIQTKANYVVGSVGECIREFVFK